MDLAKAFRDRWVWGPRALIVRHPIYLGVVLLPAGWAWWQATAWLGLLCGLVGFWYFGRKASVEEHWLASRFPAYSDYRTRVPKLIPSLW